MRRFILSGSILLALGVALTAAVEARQTPAQTPAPHAGRTRGRVHLTR